MKRRQFLKSALILPLTASPPLPKPEEHPTIDNIEFPHEWDNVTFTDCIIIDHNDDLLCHIHLNVTPKQAENAALNHIFSKEPPSKITVKLI